MCSRSHCASMPRQSDRAATAQFKPRFKVLSSNRTTPQVDRVTHTKSFADFLQLRLMLAAKKRSPVDRHESFSI